MLLLPAEARAVLFSAFSIVAKFFSLVNTMTYELLHSTAWNFARTCTLTTSSIRLNNKVKKINSCAPRLGWDLVYSGLCSGVRTVIVLRLWFQMSCSPADELVWNSSDACSSDNKASRHDDDDVQVCGMQTVGNLRCVIPSPGFRLLEEIGRGAVGIVHKAEWSLRSGKVLIFRLVYASTVVT